MRLWSRAAAVPLAGVLVAGALAGAPTAAHAGVADDGQWRRLTTVGPGPSQRSVPAVAGVNDSVYVFGGVRDDFAAGTNTFFNDTYRFDPRTHRWRRVHSLTPPPPARAFAASAGYDAGSWWPADRMYVYGGSTFSADNTEFQVFGDLWAWYPRWHAWLPIAPVNAGPGPRSGATMWSGDDALYLFGGIDGTFTTHQDLWAYHILTNQWELLSADGDPSAPGPRHVAAAGRTAAGGALTLYGGEGLGPTGFTILSDTWRFDLATGTWQEVLADPDLAPARNYGAAAVIGDVTYLQGGDVSGGSDGCGAPFPQNPTEQLWRFDPDAGGWEQLTPGGDPLPRLKRHAAAVVDGTVYVVGGWDFQCEPGPGQIWNTSVYAYTP